MKKNRLEGYFQERIVEDDCELATTDYSIQTTRMKRQLREALLRRRRHGGVRQLCRTPNLSDLWQMADDE